MKAAVALVKLEWFVCDEPKMLGMTLERHEIEIIEMTPLADPGYAQLEPGQRPEVQPSVHGVPKRSGDAPAEQPQPKRHRLKYVPFQHAI